MMQQTASITIKIASGIHSAMRTSSRVLKNGSLIFSLISRIAMISQAIATAHRMKATMRRVVALLFSSAAVRLSTRFALVTSCASCSTVSTAFLVVCFAVCFPSDTRVIVLSFFSMQTPLVSLYLVWNDIHSYHIFYGKTGLLSTVDWCIFVAM